MRKNSQKMSEFNENNEFSKSFDSLSIKTNPNQQKTNGKPKRKNSEKRKEKSRKAARERRSQESKIFDQMEALLPISAKNINHLDKASLVRLAINYLKIRKVIEPIKSVSNFKQESEPHIDEFSAPKALNGFIIVLSKEGDMVYLSEGVDKFLGLNHIDLIGQSIYDYSHPCDHNDIKDILALKQIHSSNDLNEEISTEFFVRMKCTLTNKGRNLNLKSANYKVIHCVGHLKRITNSDNINESQESMPQNSGYFMTAICQPIEQPSILDKVLGSNVFISRHSLDMKYTNIDDGIDKILGYNSEELTGKSLFNFFHALDLKELEKFFKTLFGKGQSQSQFYRFLAKSGGYLWLLTEATVITDSQSSQPQSVICVNHVISGVVNPTEVLSDVQCFEEAVHKSPQLEDVKTVSEERHSRAQPSIVSSTKAVFAPKTADMESGFIVFDNANHVTFLSDADLNHLPQDLTHLAPEAAGDDICVPFPGLLADFNELNFFDEVFLNNNISNTNLFSDDEKMKTSDEMISNYNGINDNSTVDELTDKINDNSLYKSVAQNLIKNYLNIRDNDNIDDSPLPNDPFLSHNDDKFSSSPSSDSSIDPYSSDTNSPLNISSPILSQTSNFFCKSPTEEVSKLKINDNNIDFIDEKTLEMRAPFIPIEDFPLLLDGDLPMNYSDANIDDIITFDDKLLTTSESMNRSPVMYESPPQQRANCLEALLQTDSPLKNKKINQKVRQNLNYGLKSDVLQHLKKTETNSPQNRLQLVYNNINQVLNNPIKGNSMATNDMNSAQNQRFSLNSRKAQKNCFRSDFNYGSDLVKTTNATKRPFASETHDLSYNICPNEVLPNSSSTKNVINAARLQKRFKINNNNNNDTNKGNSVLMNLLVNGEDVTNGYSKYSNIDRNNRSSNLNSYNLNQKLTVSKKNGNQLIFEGQDIR